MKKKFAKSMLAIALGGTVLAGVSATAFAEEVVLEVEHNGGGAELECLREIMADFTEETGIGVELITPGTDYESVMKTRMASGDMPDVFVTHGWSVARYGEFLQPVNDQPWVETYDEAILPAITDPENGNIYVNCLSLNKMGIYYNATVLEAAGVDPMEIKTVKDLMDACEKIKASGVTPFYLGGKDAWPQGALVEYFGPAYFTAEGCEYPSAEKLKDGSFDWTTDGKVLFDLVREMMEKGYFNEDILTAAADTEYQEFANGKCAFSLNGNFTQFRSYNPDVKAGIIAVPNSKEGGLPYFAVGEGNGDAWGVWKDSEYVEEGLQLLEYLAKPEVTTKWLEAINTAPAHTDVPVAEDNEGYYAVENYIEACGGEIWYDNIFDREYLPSGMWSVLTDSLSMVFADPTDQGVTDAVENMQMNFVEKFAATE